MGITGLIPFLEKASQPVNVSQFSGSTVVIDAYCWLHKGAFACAEKLARGDQTDQYVVYCMKYVNMLLHHNVKPILVFDGSHLKAKAETEKKRRESRELNRRKAAELLRLDRANEAKTYLRRCVDVTHEMALRLIQECRSRNVDCIVAPYEADAQLAFFNINDIAEVVITEDSDLLLFGCKKVLFKMDLNGNGLLVDQRKLYLAMGMREDAFSLEKFRYMCILSGCDYLSSLPGIGLAKACRFITRSIEPDIYKALLKLPVHLNMSQLNVSKEYRDKFIEADSVFKYQPVFNPFTRKVVPLCDPPEGESPPDLWEPLPDDQAEQMAFGNLDPFSLRQMDSWNPNDKEKPARNSVNWNGKAKHRSIWSPDYMEVTKKLKEASENKHKNSGAFVIERPSTFGKQIIQKQRTPTKKRPAEDFEDGKRQLMELYGTGVQPRKKLCNDRSSSDDEKIEEDDSPMKDSKISIEIFLPEPKNCSDPSPVQKAPSKPYNKFQKTVINDSRKVISSYFCDFPEAEPNVIPSNCNTKANNPFSKKLNIPKDENESLLDSFDGKTDKSYESDRMSNYQSNSRIESFKCSKNKSLKDEFCSEKEIDRMSPDILNSYMRKPLLDIKNTSPTASPEKLGGSDVSPVTSPEIISSKFSNKSKNPFIKKLNFQKDENESLLDSFDGKADVTSESNKVSNCQNAKLKGNNLASTAHEATEIPSNFSVGGCNKLILGNKGNFGGRIKSEKKSCMTINRSSASSQEFRKPSQCDSAITVAVCKEEESSCDSPSVPEVVGASSSLGSYCSSSYFECEDEDLVDDPLPLQDLEKSRTCSQESDEGFFSPTSRVKTASSPREVTSSTSKKVKTLSSCRQVGLKRKSSGGPKQLSLFQFLKTKSKMDA